VKPKAHMRNTLNNAQGGGGLDNTLPRWIVGQAYSHKVLLLTVFLGLWLVWTADTMRGREQALFLGLVAFLLLELGLGQFKRP